MAEQNNTQTETVTKEAPAQEQEQPQTQETPKTVAELQAELEAVKRQNKNKIEEAARIHKKLEAFEKAEEERKLAEMTELEKAQAEIAKLQADAETAKQQAQRKTTELLITSEASKLGFADPADAIHLISGEITSENAKDLLEALAKDKPYLIRKQPLNSGSSANPQNAGGAEESREEKLKRLGLRR